MSDSNDEVVFVLTHSDIHKALEKFKAKLEQGDVRHAHWRADDFADYLCDRLTRALRSSVSQTIIEAGFYANARAMDQERPPGDAVERVAKLAARSVKRRLKITRGGKRTRRSKLIDEWPNDRLLKFRDAHRRGLARDLGWEDALKEAGEAFGVHHNLRKILTMANKLARSKSKADTIAVAATSS